MGEGTHLKYQLGSKIYRVNDWENIKGKGNEIGSKVYMWFFFGVIC